MNKNKIGIIVIVSLLIILIISFIIGFVFIYKAMNKVDNSETEIVVEETLSMEEITNFPVGEPILTNLMKGPDEKSHVIKISVSLGVNTSKETAKDAESLLATMELQKPAMKDIIVGVCRNKTFEELHLNDAREVLKSEILLKMQKTFDTDLIVDVYLDEIFID